jgi:PAS domain S-box-containing protein
MENSTAAPLFPDLESAFAEVFGDDSDPIEVISARAANSLRGRDVVVWEGDPATFEFTYVSASAERVFGHPASAWTSSGFWADAILHSEDRREAIAYCALATAQCRDHQFEYRGRRADGALRWIYDVVKVVKGAKGVPVKLRGIMLDITDLKRAQGGFDRRAERRYPELETTAP